MFVVSLEYKKDLTEVDAHIEEHIAYLKKYYASGHFIASGRKVPRTGGIILVHASTREELEDILKQDPFHIAGIADYEVSEFIPSMTAIDCEQLKNFI